MALKLKTFWNFFLILFEFNANIDYLQHFWSTETERQLENLAKPISQWKNKKIKKLYSIYFSWLSIHFSPQKNCQLSYLRQEFSKQTSFFVKKSLWNNPFRANAKYISSEIEIETLWLFRSDFCRKPSMLWKLLSQRTRQIYFLAGQNVWNFTSNSP